MGKRLLNRIEVWRTGRQIQEVWVSRFDDLAHSGHLMGGEIVDNDPVAGSTFLQQDMSDIGGEHLAVDSGTIKAHPKLLVTSVWCIADVQYEFA